MRNANHGGAHQVLLLCALSICLSGCLSTIQDLLSGLTGSESDKTATATTFEPAPRASINWEAARAKEILNLKLLESDGPAWTIAFYAVGSKDKAAKEAKKLRKKNWNAHIANLASYGSANNKPLWLVYVGPYGLEEEALVRADLKTIKKKIRKKAYAVTLGPHGSRRQFNDPDGEVKHVQPKAAPAKAARPTASGACSCLRSGPGPDSSGRTRQMAAHQKSCIATFGRQAVVAVLHKNECRPVPCYPSSSHGCTSLDYETLR